MKALFALRSAVWSVLMIGIAGVSALAQQADNPVYYLLSLQSVVDNTPGGSTYGGNFNLSLTDETGTTVVSNIGGGGVKAAGPEALAKLLPNKNYTLSISGSMFVYGSARLAMRAGDSSFLQVDGSNSQQKVVILNYTGPQYAAGVGFGPGLTATRTIRIGLPGNYPLESAPVGLRAGDASSIVVDKPIWYVGLGNTRKGMSAGAFGFRAQDFATVGTINFFTPSKLVYDSPDSTEVVVIRASGALRQIFSREVLADIQVVSSTSYKIDMYARSQVGSLVSGLYSVAGQTPFVTYTVSQILSGGGVKIVRAEDGVTWETSLSVSGAATWVRKDWAVANTAIVGTATTVYSSTNAAITALTGPSSSVGGDTAFSWSKAFTDYVWGKELTGKTTGALTTGLSYYTATDTSGGYYKAVKSALDVTGSWTKFEYYTDKPVGVDYVINGSVKRIFRPWRDGPLTSDLATTANSIYTDYTYVGDVSPWPASEITTAPNGKVLSKSTWIYDFNAGVVNTYYPTIKATRKDYSDATNFLQTVTVSIKSDNTTYPNKPISVVYPTGKKEAFAYYRGTWNASTKSFSASDSGEDRMELCLHGQTTAGGTGVSKTSWTVSGTGANTWTLDSLYMVPNKSSATETIIDLTGRVVFSAENVFTSSGTLERIAGTIYRYDLHGRLFEEVDLIRTLSPSGEVKTSRTYTGNLLSSETSPEGVVTKYEYDDLLRLTTKTIGYGGGSSYPGKVQVTDYDAANRPVASYSCACGTSPTRSYYDSSGRLSSKREMSPNDSSSASQGSLLTSYDYSTLRKVITTLPTGATRIDESYLDGRQKSVGGTSVSPINYDYTANDTGVLVTTQNGSTTADGWTETQTDLLGRTVKQSSPTYGWQTGNSNIIDIGFIYDATTGTLKKQTVSYRANSTALIPDHLYVYDEAGELTSEGLDVNGDSALTAASSDRITVRSFSFNKDVSGWRLISQSGTYATLNDGTVTAVSEVRNRYTGLGAGVIAEVTNIDSNSRSSTKSESIDPAQKRRTVQVSVGGISNVAYQKQANGYDYETQTFSGERVAKDYDSKGRLAHVYSRWDGSAYTATDTYSYYNDTTYLSGISAGGVGTSYSYAWGASSRTIATTDAAGTAYLIYNAMDLPWRTFGSGTSPTEKGYDTLGRLTSLTTWRSGSFTGSSWPAAPGTGDTTTWTIQPATGLVTRKTFALPVASPAHVDYTYTALGQPLTRTWARGVTTTYGYFDGSAGTSRTQELKSISYGDSTPVIGYTYKRTGLPAEVSDVTGTRTISYTSGNPLRPDKETLGAYYNGRVRTFQYDGYGQGTGFALDNGANNDVTQTITRSATTGLMSTVVSASNGGTARTFNYAYKPLSPLVDSYTTGSFAVSYDYDATSVARRSRVEGKWSTSSITRFDLDYDDRGLVRSAKQSGAAFADYYSGLTYSSVFNYHTYDELGQAKTTAMYRGTPPTTGVPPSADELPGRRFEYRYDAAGNRVTSGATGTAAGGDDEYVPNALNQYDSKENNTVKILGTTASGANAGAQSQNVSLTVTKKDRSFAADVVPINNANAPAQGNVSVYAALVGAGTGGSDLVTSQSRPWQIAKQLQSFQYDNDGNLTSDGLWNYAYDAENRLIQMTSTTTAISAGLQNWLLEFKYDFMGRRVQKRSNKVGSGPDVYRGYIYDGWNVVAEYTVNNPATTPVCGTIQRSFSWGLDIAGSANATGGVGALLQLSDLANSKFYFPTYDGNGNVLTLVDAGDGSIAAKYEYSPFGELLRGEGPYAANNPFRFSSKWTDVESGLSYYGLRYYSCALGRFINRDPIEEAGGKNVYAFVNNAPQYRADVLGLAGQINAPPGTGPRCKEEVLLISENGPCKTYLYKYTCEDGSGQQRFITVCPGLNGRPPVAYEPTPGAYKVVATPVPNMTTSIPLSYSTTFRLNISPWGSQGPGASGGPGSGATVLSEPQVKADCESLRDQIVQLNADFIRYTKGPSEPMGSVLKAQVAAAKDQFTGVLSAGTQFGSLILPGRQVLSLINSMVGTSADLSSGSQGYLDAIVGGVSSGASVSLTWNEALQFMDRPGILTAGGEMFSRMAGWGSVGLVGFQVIVLPMVEVNNKYASQFHSEHEIQRAWNLSVSPTLRALTEAFNAKDCGTILGK